MPDAYSHIQEWPRMLYRPAEQGGIERRVFALEADVPDGQGWTDSATARSKAKPEPPKITLDSKTKASLEQKLERASRDNAELSNMLAREQATAHDMRNRFHEAQTRIADLEGFLAIVAKSDAIPAPVRESASKVLNPPAAPEPEPRRRKLKSGAQAEDGT